MENTTKIDELLSTVTGASNIPEAFWRRAESHPTDQVFKNAFITQGPEVARDWRYKTYSELRAPVARLAHYLVGLGMKRGDRIAVLSNTRYEWCLADLAILSAAGVTVSIYQSLTPQEIGYILHDSGSRIIFAENEEQVAKLLQVVSEEIIIPACEDRVESRVRVTIDKIIAFEEVPANRLVSQYSNIISDQSLSDVAPDTYKDLKRDDLASLVYTSGTTGPPKGVMQSHGNHLTNVYQVADSGVFPPEGSMFLYLPLAHSFARLAYYVGFLTPCTLAFPAIIDKKTSRLDLFAISRDLRESNSEVIPSVPRLFEKMAAAIKARSHESGLKSRLVKICLANAQRMYALKEKKQPVGIMDQIIFEGMRPIRNQIRRQLFGDNFSHGISGGAKLDPEVQKFFDAIEIPICEGYGLTETCVATNVNRPNNRRIGSVGPVFKDIEIKLDTDGEIIFRGPNITRGYWNRPQATAEAYDSSGWFRTGDIGRIDDDGFLYITDRKKDIIVTAGGKKIPPQSIEGRFQGNPVISQLVLCGDGKPYCVALVTIHPTVDKSYCDTLVEAEIDKINQTLSSFESIKRFAILEHDFSIENGFLTPTLKVKRKAVTEKFKATIEELYSKEK